MLDENISPVVAQQIQLKRPDITIDSVYTWRDGAFLRLPDEALIPALYPDRWVLVTFDTQILAEQPFLFDGALPHAGILFVDYETVAPGNFGGLIRALISFWEDFGTQNWEGRMGFLRAVGK